MYISLMNCPCPTFENITQISTLAHYRDWTCTLYLWQITTLQWRHNEHGGVSNHQPCDCLLNSLFRRRSKKTSKLRITGLCVGNSPVTSEIPAQVASNAENVSIWWRRHDHLYHHIETNTDRIILTITTYQSTWVANRKVSTSKA